MTGLSLASADPGIVPGQAATVAPVDDVSPEVIRALHADAVRLNRSELFFIVPSVVLVLAGGGAALLVPQWFWLWGAVLPVAFRVGQWAVQWRRLRSMDPLEHFHRERREDLAQATGLADFQARAAARKPVAAMVLLGGICLVTAVQFLVAGLGPSVAAAGLVKDAAWAGEWWRLLTASYLHANLFHLLGNMGALMLLAGMVEAYDRRLRVPLAHLAGVIGGSVMSLLLVPGTGIGASGGVLGLAGYLLVLAYRRPAAGAMWLRTRVLGVLGGAAVFGALGYQFIDNAAHLGGALAGIGVGVMAFPRNGDDAGRGTGAWDLAGWAATAVLAGGALFTLARLLR